MNDVGRCVKVDDHAFSILVGSGLMCRRWKGAVRMPMSSEKS